MFTSRRRVQSNNIYDNTHADSDFVSPRSKTFESYETTVKKLNNSST
jgi:hypothetical protein